MARVWGNGPSHTLLEGEQCGAAVPKGDLTRPTEMTKVMASDPAILLPGVFLQACQLTYITRDFTAAFFMPAVGWKEPKCSATEDQPCNESCTALREARALHALIRVLSRGHSQGCPNIWHLWATLGGEGLSWAMH